MVTQINDLAPGTIGFRMLGDITKEDYDNVILPVVKVSADRYAKLNLLLIVQTDLSNFTVGAWMKDAAFGLTNLATFDRVALVSDSDVVKTFSSVANTLLPGQYKDFELAEEGAARAWVVGR